MATTPTLTVPADAEVFYPERDGKPMAESEIHQDAMVDLIQGLRDHFADDPRVYVGGNLFVYYQQGDPHRNVSPDVMVILRAGREPKRRTFKVWEEGGHTPDLVIEVSSKSTRREDLRGKLALYRDVLRVREYLLFDPLEEYLRPSLRGFRLVGTEYQPIPLVDGRLRSDVLGLQLGAVDQALRLYDGATGRLIPTRLEQLRELDALARTTDTINRRLTERAERAEEANRVLSDRVERAEERAERAEERAERAEEANRVLSDRVERAEESGRTLAERVAESDRRAQQSFHLLRQELERLRAERRPD